jgi:chitinase
MYFINIYSVFNIRGSIMRRYIHFAIAFMVMGHVLINKPYASTVSSTPPRIIATYNHAEKPEETFTLENIPWSKITHFMYAGATINLSDFSLSYPDTLWNALLYCNTLRSSYNVKLLISVGGAENSSFFPKAAGNLAQINIFAGSCINLIKTLSLDGVNISWNFPADTLECKEYLQLLQALRRVTDSVSTREKRDLLLTVSIPGMIDRIDGTNGKTDIAQTAGLVDWINIDSYDYHTSADSFTCHHAPIFKNSMDKSVFFPVNKPAMYNCDSVVRYCVSTLGVPSDKITIGTAFYGRSWENVDQGDQMFGLFQKGTFRDSTRGSKPFGIDDFYVLHTIELSKPEFCHYDSVSQEPWIYDAINKIFHTYENERSVKEKCRYILDNNLGGICINTISGDAPLGGCLLTSTIQSMLNPQTIEFEQKREIPGFTILSTSSGVPRLFDLRGALISRKSVLHAPSVSGTYVIFKNGVPQKLITFENK